MFDGITSTSSMEIKLWAGSKAFRFNDFRRKVFPLVPNYLFIFTAVSNCLGFFLCVCESCVWVNNSD